MRSANLTKSLLFTGFLIWASACPCARAQTSGPAPYPTPDNPPHKDDLSWIPVHFTKNKNDIKVTLTQNLYKVKTGQMTPQAFYKALAKMPMPDGKEPRHILMEIKKDIGRYRGSEGLTQILGAQFPEGGSEVEMKLLGWRKDLVIKGIDQTIQAFQGSNQVEGHNFSVYYAEIGSWPDESPRQMQFAGDIDFNFLSGNMALALKMKQHFDGFIQKAVGMTPEMLDAPCTVHGLATPEVFIGPHGQAFAEGALKQVKRIDTGGNLAQIPFTPFNDALANMHLESHFAGHPLPNIQKAGWPTEPGITLEMIRHFEHDITGKNVFTDLQSFMKAAKYMQRSDQAVTNAGGKVSNKALSEFCKELIARKKQPRKTQADTVRAYFEKIQKPVPVEIRLGPTQAGNTPLEIAFKEKLIQDFWNDCQKAMWDNAAKGFEAQIHQLKTRMRAAGDSPQFAKELEQMRDMIEIELRVLNDARVGVKKIPSRFQKHVTEFRTVCRHYFRSKNYIHLRPVEEQKTFQFIEENLKRGNPTNVQLALGALINAPDKINDYLDMLDDTLMGEIRGERSGWMAFLSEARELTWAKKADTFLGRSTLSQRHRTFLNRIERKNQQIEAKLTKIITDSAAGRGIRSVNQIFTRSFQSSRAGRTSMKALTAINLAREIPVYVDLLAKEDWSGLAAEFIIRRVPLGAAANHLYMGRYMLAVWDVGVTIVPPAAMGELAFKVGEWAGDQAWQIYWSEELNKFIDDLYEDAEFRLIDVEEIDGKLKLSKWELTGITYQGKGFHDIPGFIRRKQKHIEAMRDQCALAPHQREFPMRYTLDGITDWMKFSELLRENIVSQDPFLVMIDGMKNAPHVGPKLKDHYLDLWYTRFEEVKLAYVLHMKTVLEERRSAEQAYLSGQLPLITRKLNQIAGRLRIQDQMDQNLKKEMGGPVYTLYAWARDWAVGIKRGLSDEAEVWEHDKECVRVLQRYLKTYQTIARIRDDLENALSIKKKGDFGLRILTGPLMLSGNPDKDKKQASHWVQLFQEIRPKVAAELTAIKTRLSASGQGLATDPKSYDQRVFKAVAAHDLWREVWKYIYRTAPKKTSSVFDEGVTIKIYKALKKAAMGTETDIEGIAKGHHAFHKKQRDRIIAAFEARYLQQKESDMAKQNKKGTQKPAFVKRSKKKKPDDAKKRKDDKPQFVKKSKRSGGSETDKKPAFVRKTADMDTRGKRAFDPSRDPFTIQSIAMETIDIAVPIESKSYEVVKDPAAIVIIARTQEGDKIIDGKAAFTMLNNKGYFHFVDGVGYVVGEKFIDFNKPEIQTQSQEDAADRCTSMKACFPMGQYEVWQKEYQECAQRFGINSSFTRSEGRARGLSGYDLDDFTSCKYTRNDKKTWDNYKNVLKTRGTIPTGTFCNQEGCLFPPGEEDSKTPKRRLPAHSPKKPNHADDDGFFGDIIYDRRKGLNH
jgi:hypothetical protein